MLSGIFFITPYFLLLSIPIVVGLVYAYRQKSNKNYKKVSSLFLFEKLRSRSLISQKVKLPWRFLAELLIFTLLLLALAGLTVPAKASKVAVLIDDSISLAARVGNSTLLDSAKTAALSSLAMLASDTKVAVINRAADKFLSIAEARSEIADITINATSNFEENLKSATASGHYAELYVFSDFIPEGSGGHEKIFYKNIKTKALANLAISNARIDNPENISLDIINFSNAPANYEVELELFKFERENPQIIKKLSQHITTTERSNVKFSSEPAADLYRIRLLAKDSAADSLAPDSEYFLLPGIRNSGQVICFSAYDTTDLKLKDFFTGMPSCQNYSEYKPEALKDQSLVLIFGFMPEVLPSANTLLIANSVKARSADIVYWSAESELLKYLKPADLKFNNSEILAPAIFQNLISTKDSIVLASAEIAAARYVYSSTQLFPYSGDRSRALSILTLNIYNWLKAERENKAGAASGEILVSRAEQLLKEPKASEFYRYVSADKSAVYNQFNAAESDTFNDHYLGLPQSFNLAELESSANSLSLKLLLAAIILLLIVHLVWDLLWRLKK